MCRDDHIGPSVESALHLLEILALDLDLDPQRSDRTRALDGEIDIAVDCGKVIVLDQDRVREVHSVVHPAARANGVFLEPPPSRSGLPRVEDVRSRPPGTYGP